VFDPPFEQPLFMLQRLLVTGFVMLFFSSDYAVRRIVFGIFATVTYMAMLLTFRPYVREDLNFLAAIGSQYSLVFIMLVALTMRIFNDIQARFDLEDAQTIMNFDGPSQVSAQRRRAVRSVGTLVLEPSASRCGVLCVTDHGSYHRILLPCHRHVDCHYLI
jgi:hypothetical protein